jgi:hypothetical protein
MSFISYFNLLLSVLDLDAKTYICRNRFGISAYIGFGTQV